MSLPNNPGFPTAIQQPDSAILNFFGKAAYLGNQFIATINTVSLTTAETPVFYTLNTTTSSKSLFKAVRALNVADNSGEVVVFRVYLNPTGVTGGTTITPVNCRPANSNTSVATCTKSPTVASNGTLASVIVVGFNAQNIDSTLFVIDPGNSLLITAQATGACIATADSVWWEL
jgi:hypothetical protein